MSRLLCFVLFLLLWPVSAQTAPFDAQAAGRNLTADFLAGNISEVWGRMDKAMRDVLGSEQALRAFHEQINTQLGDEIEVVEEIISHTAGHTVYLRRARFRTVDAVIVVQWTFAPDGRVGGFFIRPDQTPLTIAPSAHVDYQTRTALRWPFAGASNVFWGGRSLEQNYHAAHANQRFAYDVVVLKAGTTHVGAGKRNEDYHCFGAPLLAPAAGSVVGAVDGIADNVPGRMNAEQILGNHVVIDHGNDEYSLLAHLRNGSVQVRAGEHILIGQQLAECGNSGNSSEAHLHYQLQEGPEFGVAAALPAQFVDYLADGQFVARGEPVKGQHISAAPGG